MLGHCLVPPAFFYFFGSPRVFLFFLFPPRFTIFLVPPAFFYFFGSPRVFLFPPRFFGAPAKLRGDFTGDFFLIRGFFFKNFFFHPRVLEFTKVRGIFPRVFKNPRVLETFFCHPRENIKIPRNVPANSTIFV